MDHRIKIKVNGTDHDLEVLARRMLVDCLRYDLGLTGTKEGCSVGVCGACTVLVDGQMVASCIMLAVTADGADITTVEGLAQKVGCTLCSRRSSTTAVSSAESARRVK